MSPIIIYITNPTKEEARKIARHLLEKKIIACGNIFSVDSLYWWEGKIADENEFVLICKTLEENFEKVKKEVESIHSCSVPCILKIPVEASDKFLNFLKKEVS